MASTGGLRSLKGMQELGLVIVVLAIGGFLSTLGHFNAFPGQGNLFLNYDNLIEGIATPMSIYAIMAIGMTCVIITGGIDISVGSVMAMAALGGAAAMEQLPIDAPWWKVLPVGVLVPVVIGLACGVLNGACVVGLRMHPFIVTLGTMSIFRGLATVLPPQATLPSGGKRLPIAFTPDIMRWQVGGLEIVPLLVMLGVFVVGAIYLWFLIAGRETYAVGGNEEAARFSGIRVGRVKFRVYMISGLCAGIAAVVSLGRFGTASSNTGLGYELVVVAAAVIGGASLAGGRGTAIGAILGTLIIAMIDNAIITFLGKSEYRQIIIGAAIIVAVALERAGHLVRGRKS
ncbi:MAG: ABC transporter permease [Burkholderiales bacterium]|nr:ABC transporter permease [Phycisphaerae bacterium]